MPDPLSHIAFIAGSYPSALHPYAGMFLQQLIHAHRRHGLQCSVVVPTPVHHWLRSAVGRGGTMGSDEEPLAPLRPLYVSMASPRLGPLCSPRASQVLFQWAALQSVRRLKQVPDAFYGHFLYPAGGAAVWLGRRLKRPSFVAMGEGSLWTLRGLGYDRAKSDFARATGLLAVSTLLKKKLVAELAIPPEKIAMIPNGVDLKRFYPRPRGEMRAKWHLPRDAFLTVFVGNYNYDKGVERVVAAIEGLENVAGMFAGSGRLVPRGEHVLFQDRVPHDCLPELLSAADVFVLPTTHEGSCNAIIEAMACGLPIVTSVGEFNDDLVDNTMAMRVDPLDVPAVRNAVGALRDNMELRQRMGQASLIRARGFDLDARARNIESWMNERIWHELRETSKVRP
jgi:teichuronic acid biosynthesis glycosyltransferase TuaC